MTGDQTCVVCEERPAQDALTCQRCDQRARGHLRAIQELADDARAVAAGLVRRGPHPGSGKPASRPPLNTDATDALTAVQSTLTTLARDIAETRGLTITVPTELGHDPLIAAAHWLGGQIDWLRHATTDSQPWAPGAYAEIRTCETRLRSLVNGPSEQRFLGPCGAEREHGDLCQGAVCFEDDFTHACACWCHKGETSPCGGDVYAIRGATTGRCRTCRTDHDTATRETWLDTEVRQHNYTARDIADAYNINVKTIRTWHSRGQLAQHGTDPAGRPLHNVGEVLDLAAADAARKAEQQAHRARRRDTRIGAVTSAPA